MSFRCALCNIAQPNKAKPKQLIIEKRNKVYPVRYGYDDSGKRIIIDEGGTGWEIVREAHVCQSCYEDWQLSQNPDFVAAMTHLVQGVDSGEIPLEQFRRI